jgi:hypothetical protein
LGKPPFACSKIYQTLQNDKIEDKEQISFWMQVQIRTKIPGKKTIFEFGPNLLGYKLVWKNLTNSPKFLFALPLQIVNLDWHGCMAKSKVSTQTLLGLGVEENENRV